MVYTKQALQEQQQRQEYAKLVDQYSALVAKIAHHLAGRLPNHIAVDDLIQAGMIGLFEASKKFEDGKGASFETFAGIRIRGAMLDEVRKGEWAPRSVHKNNREIAQTIRRLEQGLGRAATDREIANALNISLDEYSTMLNDCLSTKLFSLDEVIFDDGGTQIDRVADHSEGPNVDFERSSFIKKLAEEIENLPEKEKLVLSLYYDEEFNLREIGEVLGVSESRVSQLHGQAAMRLRSRLSDWSDEQDS